MEPKSCQVFSVTRQQPELIIPARPLPREVKRLSDIADQQGLRFLMPVLFFYRNNASPFMKGKDPVKVIREALSKALVFYYPLAGRLQEGPNKKLMVDCNGKGILFIEADANVTLEQLGDEINPPFPYWNEVMYDVPGSRGIIGCPLLFIQVTRLRCGGFILALFFNHTMLDGAGLIKFLKAVVELANGAYSPSVMPVWQHNILSARDSPRITCTHHEYEIVEESKGDANSGTEPLEHKSFYFGQKEISTIRNNISQNLRNSTTFEILAGYIWRCRTAALKLHPDQIVRYSCVVNMRGKHYDILPPGYYGVGFACPAARTKVDDLCNKPLGYAVELVKNAKAKMNEEYIKSVADFMVLMGRPKFTPEGNFLVSDITSLGCDEIDFGWGKPVYGGVPEGTSMIGYHEKYKNKDGEVGTIVVMCLPRSAMERFEKELKKITQGSVEDLYTMKMKMKMKHTRILSKF
ncbi:Benzyl alcohol O-benzoyltransferase [Melia azedarach]|uniref:Benzyl alcohol O-benzoyltransferase n=1 Tax=Melia azedarach TaxID=155640 RepID=A0ACC1YKS9_MELAZ|nr:Benzyl alcohol O-benzoyltransferase [Melia azedarach]